MSIHVVGVLVLILIFAIGSWRPINLGALALVASVVVGAWAGGVDMREVFGGFPVELLVLLVAVTYLFALAARNGTIEWLVSAAAGMVRGRRALVPWLVFVIAALPTTAGALGSAGVALLAPIALRLAERYGIDRRLIALMVLHGAACGNFSPVNVLGAIVHQSAAGVGSQLTPGALFLANVAYNVFLGVIVYFAFGGQRLARAHAAAPHTEVIAGAAAAARSSQVDRVVTLLAIAAVAGASLAFGLGIGVLALMAAVCIHLLFPHSSRGAERDIAWDVILLVCGIVTYVALLQRLGTLDAVGERIAALGSPLLGALLVCAVGAFTSAFASSAGILGAMMLMVGSFVAQGNGMDATGVLIALAISATVVDSCPFSTAGALVVANTRAEERERVYRALLIWGALMVVTAPLITWALFIVPRG
jgi:di/tricarboxylate transporter